VQSARKIEQEALGGGVGGLVGHGEEARQAGDADEQKAALGVAQAEDAVGEIQVGLDDQARKIQDLIAGFF
jgi:hypothetical protein